MPRNSAVATFLDLLYPPRCPACDASISDGAPLCETCAVSLYEVDAACPRCGEPQEGPRSILCWQCRDAPPPYGSLQAPYRYGGELAVAVQRMKYQRRADIARTLAPLLAPALRAATATADLIVPVPLHWRRQSRRGFNQALALVEEALAPGTVPVDRLSLRRVRATAVQASLSRADRAGNVAEAFRVVPRRRARVAGRTVLLVDDVATTGATMAAAARALLIAGAARVDGLCLARAEP